MAAMAAGAVRHAQWNPYYIGFDWASPLDDPSAPGNMRAEVNQEMNALWKAINETTDFAEYSRLIREMDRIYLTDHWTLAVACCISPGSRDTGANWPARSSATPTC